MVENDWLWRRAKGEKKRRGEKEELRADGAGGDHALILRGRAHLEKGARRGEVRRIRLEANMGMQVRD